ncbi:MAG: glycoside hydrolase domain-containing protein, partial [Bacteroidota bacterium]
DAKKALKAMEASVNQARLGQIAYRENGYVPSDEEPESVSKTLEYAYDDWCVGQMARALSDDLSADKYFRRSLNYRNLFDPSTRFFRARNNGAWHWPFDPFEVNFNYTEANA